jgi:hypothetical protein
VASTSPLESLSMTVVGDTRPPAPMTVGAISAVPPA